GHAGPRHEPADLRVHRRRDRRARLDRGLRRRRADRRPGAAVRELLRVERSRRHHRRAAARARAARAPARPLGGLRVSRRAWEIVLPLALLVGLAFVPKISADIPKLFNGPIDSPGTLQLLALCLVFGGVALTYDLLFGFTGLLSFGHAFYFAVGVYMTAIAVTRWHWGFYAALAFVALLGLVLPLAIGAVRLRVGGIAFAMVTLAVAQVGAVLAIKNPFGWTGGEEGFGTDYQKLPDAFVGVLNTKNLYWLALGYAAAVFLVVRWAVESSPGRVWQAVRENE